MGKASTAHLTLKSEPQKPGTMTTSLSSVPGSWLLGGIRGEIALSLLPQKLQPENLQGGSEQSVLFLGVQSH
jgi:hypothetical protein